MADNPAPVWEKIRAESENISDKATNILIDKLPREEKTQADHTANETPTTEGEFFSKTPSTGEVHYEPNKVTSEEDGLGNERNSAENPDTEEEKTSQETSGTLIKATSNNDDTVPSFCEKGNLPTEKGDGLPEDYGRLIGSTVNKSQGDVENQSKLLEEINDEQLEKESENLPPAEVLEGCTNDNEPIVIQKEVIENFSTIVSREEIEENSIKVDSSEATQDLQLEDKELRKIELCENEVQSLKANPQGLLVEKTFDAAETENTLQNADIALSYQKTEKNSLIQVDGTHTTDEDHLGKENTTESALLKDEMQVEKTVESAHVAIEDVKGFALDQRTETRRSLEEQSLNENQQGILSHETEDRTIDVSKTEEETSELQDVATNALNEDIDKKSSNQVDVLPMKHEEHLTNGENLSLTEDSTRKAYEGEPETMDVPQIRDIELMETERTTQSTLEKEETLMEKSVDSSPDALEVIKASASVQVMEEILNANPQVIVTSKTEGETHDAASMEETLELQNVATNMPHEETEETLLIQVDCSKVDDEDYLEKENEGDKSLTSDSKAEQSKIARERGTREEDCTKAEIFEKEEIVEATLVMKEALQEKQVDSLKVEKENNKGSASDQETETSSVEEKILTANQQKIPNDKTEDELIDATNVEETIGLQTVETNVTTGDSEDSSPDQRDESEMIHKEHLETERETLSLVEALTGNTNKDESTVIHGAKSVDEDIRKIDLSENEKTTGSPSLEGTCDELSGQYMDTSCLEVQSPTENPQEIAGGKTEEKTIDADENKEETLELQNVATSVSNEDIYAAKYSNEDIDKVHGSQLKHEEHFKKEGESLSLTEDSKGDAYKDKPKTMDEPEIEEEELIETQLMENEKITESTLENEEALTDKSVDSLPVALEDIKASISVQDKETSSIKEKTLNANPQVIGCWKTEGKPIDVADTKEPLEVQNHATIIQHGEIQEMSLTEVDCSKMEDEECLKKEIENQSSTTSLTPNTNDEESKTVQEREIREEDCTKAEMKKNDTPTETTVVMEEPFEEKHINSLKVATDKGSASDQEIETSFIQEKILTASPQNISADITDEETNDAADKAKETIDLQNVATNLTIGDDEDNSPDHRNESEMIHEEHLEEENKKLSVIEASTGNTSNDESTITHDAKAVDEDLIKIDLSGNEKNTGSTLLKDTSGDSMQLAPEDFKAFASGQATETNSLKELSLNENPLETVAHKTEEKINYAAETKETLELRSVAVNVSNEETAKKSFIQVDGSQMEDEEHLEKEIVKPSAAEVLMEDADDVDVVNIGNEIKTELLDGEENKESASLQKEREMEKPIENVPVDPEDIKVASSEDKVTTCTPQEQNQTAGPKETMGDKTNDAAKSEENVEKTIPHENNEEHLEKEVEKPSATEVLMEDAADTEEETSDLQSVAIPDGNNEDNSSNQKDGSQVRHEGHLENEDEKPCVIEASTGDTNDDESIIMHKAKSVDGDLQKADVSKNEKNTGSNLVKDTSVESLQAHVDIKTSASGQDGETSYVREQRPTEKLQGITNEHKEEEINDATHASQDTPEERIVAINASNKHLEKDSLIEVDGSPIKSETLTESESEKLENIADDESTIFNEVSTIEESLYVKERDISTEKGDDKKDVRSQENEEHTETSSRATEDQSKETENDPNEFIGHVKEEKIDEDLEKTIMADDIEIKKTDAEHHLGAHSEATDEEIIIPRVETNQESDGCRDNTTETINEDYEARSNCTVHSAEEAEVKVSNEDEEKEMEPNTEVPKEMVNSEDISTKTIESDEEERDIKNMQMTTPVDIAASQETGSDSVAVKDPHTKVSNASQDTEVKTSEGTNCKQEEPSFTELSEEDIRISNEKVANDRSLESGATELTGDPKLVVEDNKCDDRKDVEKMGVLDDGSVIATQNENPVEAIQKESPEVQFPDAEKEAELMQHDPEMESPQKEIEVEQPIKVSPDVSESNVDGEAEERNSDNCKEISTISNSVEVEEISSPNAFQEPRSETLQEAEDTEAEKQHEVVPVLAQISDLSIERTEKDVQLCVASSGGTGITQEMQKLEEMSSPAQDQNVVGKGDSNCNKLNNTSEDKNVEQEETTKGFLVDEEPPESEQAVILDEKVEEEYFKETSKVENPVSETKRVINTEELQIGKTISGEEGDEGNEQKISDFSSAAPNMTEARNQDPTGSLSEAPQENSSSQVAAEANSFETADTRECTVVNDKPRSEDSLLYSSTETQDTKLDGDAPETVETIRNAVESQEVEKRAVSEHAFISDVIEKEKNMELGQELPSQKEENMNFEVDEIIKSNTESREILKPEEQEKVVESIAQVQTCDVITDTSKLATEKENLEAAKEIKSDKFVADERFESKQTTYEEKETMEVNILSEKVDKADEAAENYHLSSCEEEVITGSHLEDQVKQEENINKEEFPDATKNEKVSRVREDADDKAVEEPEDSWLASVSTERSFEKEQVFSVEDITTVLDTHACTKTGTEGSREEVNSYNVASIEDESKRTEAGDLDIELKRDEGLPDESTNTSVIAVIAGELPEKKDEDVISEDAPAKTVHTTIQDCGAKEENENTIMTQHQEMDIKSKYESCPIPEFQQEKEFEKQEEEPEVRSDSAAVAEATRVDNQKEEEATDECKGMAEPLTLEESTKISTPEVMQEYEIKDQEAKDTLTELRDLPRETLVKDSGVDGAQKDDPLDLRSIKKISEDVQELKDGSSEVSNEENQVEADQYGHKEAKFSSCAQEAEATQGCPVSETIEHEIEEQKPGATSETISELKTTSYDVEQKIDDDYNDGWRDNSRIVTKEMVLDSDTHQASVEKSSTLSAKPQESQNEIDPVPALPDIEIGEKDQTPLPALDKNATPEEDRSEYVNPTSSIDKKHGESAEFSRGKGEILKPSELEQGKEKCGREETAAGDTTEDMDKSSLSDLLQVSIKDTLKVADHFASVKEPTIQKEELQVEKNETEHDCTKADDGKYDQEESCEQRKPDSGYEAPVLVDAEDANAKVVHKKSHNILSGVGSKVKHSISKVKKAITGKSSHPKPPSPK